jgi:probable rRNA maturation factor
MINQTDQRQFNSYRRYVKPVFLKTIEMLKKSETLECSLILLDDAQMQLINKEYRGKDTPTDVISFAALEGDPVSSDEHYIGDIFINMDAMHRQAMAYGHTRKREFCFLFAHGLLHCLGYDHQNESEERTMFELQELILNEIAPRSTQKTDKKV